MFFDSYALVEMTRGNPKFAPYLECDVVITIFNLAELVYSVLNEFGKEKADEICMKFDECVHEISNSIILEAMEFRKENKKRNLSYADCIGYIFAKRNNLKFLTGDEQFRYFSNVEFVKA